jgi:lipopolysaccharide export system permease protein
MIFKKALRQELAFTTGVVFMVLVTLVLTNLMVRMLSNAASGNINPKDVVVLMGLSIINYLAILLAVSLFVAVLVVLTRWYKDSEMVIWQSSGMSLFQVWKSILLFTLPVSLTIALLAMVISPIAAEQSNIIRQRFQQRDDIAMIAPGQFKESVKNNRVFFIEEINTEQNTMKNIFISDFGKERQFIAVAKEGAIENSPSGERKLVLNNGRKYEGTAGNPQFRITEFSKYTVILDQKKAEAIAPTQETKQIWELLKDWNPVNQAEFLWKMGLPLMALCFATIALPLAYTNPRNGRYYSLMFAVLIYFSYSNLLALMQTWVRSGRISFAMAWWPIHLSIFLIGIILIYLGQNKSITFSNRYRSFLNKKRQ